MRNKQKNPRMRDTENLGWALLTSTKHVSTIKFKNKNLRITNQ